MPNQRARAAILAAVSVLETSVRQAEACSVNLSAAEWDGHIVDYDDVAYEELLAANAVVAASRSVLEKVLEDYL